MRICKVVSRISEVFSLADIADAAEKYIVGEVFRVYGWCNRS